jgi:hypothetical protein
MGMVVAAEIWREAACMGGSQSGVRWHEGSQCGVACGRGVIAEVACGRGVGAEWCARVE